MTKEKRLGLSAWGATIVGVGIYEVFCPANCTMSEALDDFVDTRLGKFVIGGIGALTVAHLVNVCPEQIDLFHKAGQIKDKIKGVTYEPHR